MTRSPRTADLRSADDPSNCCVRAHASRRRVRSAALLMLLAATVAVAPTPLGAQASAGAESALLVARRYLESLRVADWRGAARLLDQRVVRLELSETLLGFERAEVWPMPELVAPPGDTQSVAHVETFRRRTRATSSLFAGAETRDALRALSLEEASVRWLQLLDPRIRAAEFNRRGFCAPGEHVEAPPVDARRILGAIPVNDTLVYVVTMPAGVEGRRIPSAIGVDPDLTNARPATIPVLRVDGAWRIRSFLNVDRQDRTKAECVADTR